MRLRSRRAARATALSRPAPVVADLLVRAQHEAAGFRHHWIGTEHMLLALFGDNASPASRALRRLGLEAATTRSDVLRIVGEGPAPGAAFDADALRAIGIDLDAVRARVDETFGDGALDRAERARDHCGFSGFGVAPRLKQALELARREAQRRGRDITEAEVLLGLSLQPDAVAARILEARGISPDAVRRALQDEHARDA